MTIFPAIARRRVIGAAGASLALGRPASADDRQKIVLGWHEVSPSGVIVLAAMRNGLFAQHGVDVVLRAGRPGDPPFDQLLRTGAVDACVAPAPIMLEPMKKGLDACFTAGLSGGGLRLLADRHARLRRIEDVKHHQVGVVDVDGPARLFFSVMLRRKGINPFAEVTWVNVPAPRMGDALRDHGVDAVAMSDPDAFALKSVMELTEIATNASGSYRERTFAALVVSGNLLRGPRRVDAIGLTGALLEAAHFVATQPKDATSFAASLAPASLDAAALVQMLRTEAPDQHPVGAALVDDIAAYVDELRLLGTMPFDLNSGRFARTVCQDVGKG